MKTLKAMLKDKNVASISATSKHTIRKIIDNIDFDADIIVEFGAGEGPITRELLKNMKKESVLYAFETNKELVHELQKIKDERLIVINESAEEFEKHISECDYIISGIPFSFLNEKTKTNIINKSHEKVKKAFIAYQTTPKLKKDLEMFDSLKIAFTIDIPPLFIMTAKKLDD